MKNTINNLYTLSEQYLYRDIVLLYCPEKVGSTSIATSIRTCASDKFIVFHSHQEEIFNIKGENQTATMYYSDIIKNVSVINKNTGTNRKIYVIDIYRTPIERKISLFFQNIAEFHFNNTEENLLNYPIEKIIKRFNDIYMNIDEIDYYNEKYEIPKITQFDFEKKYIMYEKDGVTWIKLRLKDFNLWDDILSQILNTKIIMIKDYSTENKIIGPIYKKFKSEYKLPINYFNYITVCSNLKKYYTEQERNEYLEFWKHKVGSFHIGFNLQEYFIYKMISSENNFYKINSNEHYGDDGCICNDCIQKRKIIFQDILLGKNNNTCVKHKYDDKYNCGILIRIYNKIELQSEKYIDTVINYFNIF